VPKTHIIKSIGEVDFTPDKTGCIKIQIDRENKMIEALFYHNNDEKPSAIVKGKEVTEIYQTIIREKMVEKLDHAAYLGKELEKAELALKLGRSYVQDEDLF
jgi:dihydropteroate synthase